MDITISTSGLTAIAGFIATQTISFIIFCINLWKELYILKSEVNINQSNDGKEIEELSKEFKELSKKLTESEKETHKRFYGELKRVYDKLEKNNELLLKIKME